jgi:hypothetical protein
MIFYKKLNIFTDWFLNFKLNISNQEGGGIVQLSFTGPTSVIISLWWLQVNFIPYGVPIPAPRGSPLGPNQWLFGAPVVLALIPWKVVPFKVLPNI